MGGDDDDDGDDGGGGDHAFQPQLKVWIRGIFSLSHASE